MNVIIIGGTGFLGSALITFLQKNAFPMHLITISRTNVTMEGVLHINLSAINWKDVPYYLPESDENVIIDFAYSSVPKTSFDDPIKDFTENLHNTIDHLRFAIEVKCKKYIYISSGGTVYGDVSDKPIKENAANFPISPYGITKMASERYINMYHVVHGLSTCIVRPSNVYGPTQKPFLGQGFISTALAFVYKQEAIRVFGDGSVVRDYLYIDDFCEGLTTILLAGESGEIYNLGSGTGHSILEVINRINQIVKEDNQLLKVDYLNPRSFDVQHNVLDCAKLAALTGWTSKTSFDDGIRHTWKWIKQYMTNL